MPHHLYAYASTKSKYDWFAYPSVPMRNAALIASYNNVTKVSKGLSEVTPAVAVAAVAAENKDLGPAEAEEAVVRAEAAAEASRASYALQDALMNRKPTDVYTSKAAHWVQVGQKRMRAAGNG